MTTRYTFFHILLLMPLVSVGCSEEMAPTRNGVAAEKPAAGDDSNESDSRRTNVSVDDGTDEKVEETSPEELLTYFPINQFESRDEIIMLAKEIKRLSEAPSKTDEERFANYSFYLYRMFENIGLLNKYCREDKEKLMRQRLDFLIALHQPVVEKNILPDKEVLLEKKIAEATAQAERDGGEFGGFGSPNRMWHSTVIERILQQKKPKFYKDIKDEGLGDFYFAVMYCGINHDESEPVDYCPRITSLPLPDGFPDPLLFCADFMESYYQKVIEPKQVFDFLNRELGATFRTKVTKFAGDGLSVMNPVIGDTDKAEKIIALVEKHRPGNAKALREWRAKVRRRLLQQVQDSAKHQLVLVQRAEEEFRKNDADGNGVKDYWVADVSGLYRLQGSSSDPIGLIDAGIASIDAAPLPKATKGCVDQERPSPNSAYETFPYKLQMISRGSSGKEIATVTDGSGPKWFNENQFALCGYPREYPRLGRNTYLIDESGQLWMKDTQGKPVERRPADYDADGWSKTKITPKYESRVEVDYGGLKVQQRIMSPRQQLLFEIQQREAAVKLLKSNAQRVRLSKIDDAIARTIDPKMKETLLAMRNCVEDEKSSLDLREKQLDLLPPEIGLLTNLTELNLFRNKLSSLPHEIAELKGLTTLVLECNEFATFPPEALELTNLKELYLGENLLKSLPREIGKLSNLTYLNVRNNQLTSLPSEIGELKNLERLYLRHNQLNSLPSEIGTLTKLKSVWIGFNPVGLPDLKSSEELEDLDIHETKVTKEQLEALKRAIPELEVIGKPLDTLEPTPRKSFPSSASRDQARSLHVDADRLQIAAREIRFIEVENNLVELIKNNLGEWQHRLTKSDKIYLSRKGRFDPWKLDGLNEDVEVIDDAGIRKVTDYLDTMTIAKVIPAFEYEGKPLLNAEMELNEISELSKPRIVRELTFDLERKGFSLIGNSKPSLSHLMH
jgi:Leucine-rich repeat (LRR) protein